MTPGDSMGRRQTARRRLLLIPTFVLLVLVPSDAHASFLSPELEDKLATFLALFVIFIVPAVLIVLFWMVHVMPEKIAHKRHHPQSEAIRMLCLLSLVFGGLLWPLAWLWAYSKPVMYKIAYGTDKHPDALEPVSDEDEKAALEAERRQLVPVRTLRERVASLEERVPADQLQVLRADLDALEAKFTRHEVP